MRNFAYICLLMPFFVNISNGKILYYWSQLVGHHELSIRIIADKSDTCPVVKIEGTSHQMVIRVKPSSRFPVWVCQYNTKDTVHTIVINNFVIPAVQFLGKIQSKSKQKKIAFIGDTGCRVALYEQQDCSRWPFHKIARMVAKNKPQVIVHLGDYLYRESPCFISGCKGSPHGYNWKTWQADFFNPAQFMLSVSPFIFVRGNHESCNRAFEGWYRFFYAGAYTGMCNAIDAPYTVRLSQVTFRVIDSSSGLFDRSMGNTVLINTLGTLGNVGNLNPAFIVTHKPAWGYVKQKLQMNGTLIKVLASYPEYKGIISGHIHLGEYITHHGIIQIISGNSGTKLDHFKGRISSEYPLKAVNLGFGYTTYEKGVFSLHTISKAS